MRLLTFLSITLKTKIRNKIKRGKRCDVYLAANSSTSLFSPVLVVWAHTCNDIQAHYNSHYLHQPFYSEDIKDR